MYADASHSGLRPKRCLAVQLHSIMPTTRLHSIQVANFPKADSLELPKSRQTIVTALKRANSRFFTDCYPISAALAPKVNQIATRERVVSKATFDHAKDN